MNKRQAKQIGDRNGYGAAIYCDAPDATCRFEASCDCSQGNYCEDCLTSSAYDSEQNARQFSPFEFTASAINKSGNRTESLWNAYDEGVAAGIKRGVARRLQGDERAARRLQETINERK